MNTPDTENNRGTGSNGYAEGAQDIKGAAGGTGNTPDTKEKKEKTNGWKPGDDEKIKEHYIELGKELNRTKEDLGGVSDTMMGTPDTEWEKDFVATWHCYNLKNGTPAGAEKEAVKFIKDLLHAHTQEVLQGERERIRKCFDYFGNKNELIAVEDIMGIIDPVPNQKDITDKSE